MEYPNVGAPSPQEIYAALKNIPNDQQGKQMLTQLAQQGKQTGSIEGGIATALLNSYNQVDQAKQVAQPPQGTVADNVIAQAQPPMPQFNPNMAGLATPGLEQVGQQQAAQRMATGGIVALAHGGPVRGFENGGDIGNPWMGGMPQVPDAPDTSAVEQDYFSAPAPTTPKETPAKHTYEQKLDMMQKLYGTPPDVAAEIISQHEHENARRSKFNAFENIAAALGGYLGSYGSGQHRAGAGLMSMLGTMGEHQRAEDKERDLMDTLRAKSLMAPYEQRKSMMDQILSTETAGTKAEREFAQKVAELKMKGASDADIARITGQFGLAKEGMQGQTSKDVANIHANAQVRSAMEKLKTEGLSYNNLTSVRNALSRMVADGQLHAEDLESAYEEAISSIRRAGGESMPQQQASPSYGQPLQLGNGAYPAWLR